MLASDTDRAILALLTLTHPSIPTPTRVVNDIKDLTFQGDTFVGLPFDISLAGETEETISEVTLVIDNVDRRLVEAARLVGSSPQVMLQLVAVDSAGTVTKESGDMVFKIHSVDADALKISCTLGFEADYLNEPAVKDRFDPTVAPGMF
jgi:hypothetical protein